MKVKVLPWSGHGKENHRFFFWSPHASPQGSHIRIPLLLTIWPNILLFWHFDQILKTKARETVKLDFHRPPAHIFTSRMYFFHYSLFQKKVDRWTHFRYLHRWFKGKTWMFSRFFICFCIERIGLKSMGLIHGVSIIWNIFRTVSTKLGFIIFWDIRAFKGRLPFN